MERQNMKQVTFSLPLWIISKLKEESNRRCISLGIVLREALYKVYQQPLIASSSNNVEKENSVEICNKGVPNHE